MLQIKIPFGFKTIALDKLLVIYTGKIRFKADLQHVVHALGHVENITITQHKNGCVCVSYATLDYYVQEANVAAINALLCTIMHERINAKYNPNVRTVEPVVLNDFEDLTF